MLPYETDSDETMRAIADVIVELCGPKYGFAVFVFPFNIPETANYISNASRKDMIKALREKADILEKKLDIQNSGNIMN